MVGNDKVPARLRDIAEAGRPAGVRALISVEFLADISWTGWVFAVLAIFVARPVALWLSFLRSGRDLPEQAETPAWHGALRRRIRAVQRR